MKNIHVLPTDKPSRLVKIYNDVNKENFTLKLDVEVNDSFKEYTNVFITSEITFEEIKEGDWFHIPNQSIGFEHISKGFDNILDSLNSKKIILTTDQDLIKDGVQAIDDEFLEWFVKNPSCEEVKIIYGLFNTMGRQVDPMNLGQNHSQCVWIYKIIIPKEEDKQETLEEAKKRILDSNFMNKNDADIFEMGVKWQQEQDNKMYSEEDMREAYKYGRMWDTTSFEDWFEQFKNK